VRANYRLVGVTNESVGVFGKLNRYIFGVQMGEFSTLLRRKEIIDAVHQVISNDISNAKIIVFLLDLVDNFSATNWY
jgi:hypothetical protein